MKLFNDHKKEVIDAFILKSAAGQLPPLTLIVTEPAGLRDECVDRECLDRYRA